MRSVARWIFFATLAFAPWAYGGTTAVGIETINWLLLTVLLLWVIELAISWRKPRFSRAVAVIVFCLLGLGGWMALNAFSMYDGAFHSFAPLRNLSSGAPGSVDFAISAAWMIRAALLLGVVLFVSDLSQDNVWLLRLWQAIGVVAGSIALLGLLQKATGAGMIFWQEPSTRTGTTFFSTFYYHANAGAFLNLVWPLTAGLAFRAFSTKSSPGARAAWLSIFILNLAAVAANTSRMAQLIAVGSFVAVSWHLGPALIRRFSRLQPKVALGGAAAILLTLFALGQAVHLEQPLNRWARLSEQVPIDARWLASSVALGAVRDAGAFGFGPGTFRAVFPIYNSAANHPVLDGWRFLHEDYLQTWLEWGWFGSGLWALLFFGGMAVALRSLRTSRARQWTPRRRVILPLIVIALAGVSVHALVDFPLQIMSIQLYVATYLGLCWGSVLWKTPGDQSIGKPEKLPRL
jgi:O-Antigen ligase